eukprot:m.50616 g.50616  ORF g.50616 m.50616 type:complete len:867 (+) comp7522_c0_seq2:130-2730(+)
MSVRKRIHSRRLRRASTVENALAGQTPWTPEVIRPQSYAPLTEENSPNPWKRFSLDGKAKNVGIFTSGGDAQGMNAAVRAAAAVCLQHGVKAFAIFNGYKGLIEGGEMIKELNWDSISNMMHKGGTVIGSARCKEFRERSGRKKAARNLIANEINCLIPIGGDGSLTGANAFKTEWPEFIAEFQEEGVITAEEAEKFEYLAVMGMVGSIDNDMCGFSMTIGCDSALHRICEAVDAVTTTAQSHQRTFIIEVMGRNCGFLALMTALACGADYVIIPEHPPPFDDWEAAMCDSLRRRRRYTNFSLVIVAEGATDRFRKAITAEHVKKTCQDRLGFDTRVTTLGHVQRGGAPSAYDRQLATRCGAEAAIAVLNATPTTPARIVGIRWNQMVQLDLTEAVERTRLVGKMLEKFDYDAVKDLRGSSFKQEMNIFLRARQHHMDDPPEHTFNVLIFNTGAPAAGMNAAARSLTRDLINGGHNVFASYGGLEGMLSGDVKQLTWASVKGWSSLGGCILGTSRTSSMDHPSHGSQVSKLLKEKNIHGIVCIGGFEAFESLSSMEKLRAQFEEFCVPLALIPATISNNVPGTTVSIGADTALNIIINAVDTVRQSAISSRRRAFVVETQGGYCGYLASMGALLSGADGAYIFEEGLRLHHLVDDINLLNRKFKQFHCAVFLKNERCSASYDTDFVTKALDEEGKPDSMNPFAPVYSSRSVILGHLQQGGSPSPLDRIRAARLAASAVQYLLKHMSENWDPEKKTVRTQTFKSASVIGIFGRDVSATPFKRLEKHIDRSHRLNKDNWWMNLHRLTRVLENSMRPFDELFQGEAVVALADIEADIERNTDHEDSEDDDDKGNDDNNTDELSVSFDDF